MKMDLERPTYTIGVKRRFLPGYRRLKAVRHQGFEGSIEVTLTDDSVVRIPASVETKMFGDMQAVNRYWADLRVRREASEKKAQAQAEAEALQKEQERETIRNEAVNAYIAQQQLARAQQLQQQPQQFATPPADQIVAQARAAAAQRIAQLSPAAMR